MIFRIRPLTSSVVAVINFQLLLFLLLIALLKPVWGMASEDIIYSLCVILAISTAWIFFTIKYIDKDLFNFYSLFICASVFFNGGQAILEVFHLNLNGILDGKFSAETLVKTLYLVILSLVSFHMGGLLSVKRLSRLERGRDRKGYEYDPVSSLRILRLVGGIFIAISIVPAFKMTVEALRIVLSGGYFALFQQDVPTGMNSGIGGIVAWSADFFIPGLIFLLIGSKNYSIIRKFIWGTLLAYCCALLFLGHRSSATLLLVSGLWVWHRVMRPLPWVKIFIGGAFLLFVIFPTTRIIRNIDGTSRLDLQVIVDSFFSIQNPATDAISEMGGSMGTVAYTVELVPSERPFAMGLTYLYGASVLVPNLFWDIHPAVKYGNLSNWLTLTVDPYTFFMGGGLGYSFIAESYINFGWWGTPFFMMLLGFIIAKLTIWAAGKEEYGGIAFVSGCIATMLFWPRADITIFLRPLDYYFLPAYVLFIYLRRRSNPVERIGAVEVST